MSLKNLKNRITYYGGGAQQKRMQEDKLRSLKGALSYSYQAATVILPDGNEYRCLINPDKLSMDIDHKILSIPYNSAPTPSDPSDPDIPTPTPPSDDSGKYWEDMEDLDGISALARTEKVSYSKESSNIKEGDVIEWKENGTHWLVFLQHLEETAYFRASLRRCRYEIKLKNGSTYWAYVRGPVEQSAIWMQANKNYFNKLNYSLLMYVTQNEETLEYFTRFTKIMINGAPWEVQAVDRVSTPGIIEISLKETFDNVIERNVIEAIEKEEAEEELPPVAPSKAVIQGKTELYPYDITTYTLKNYFGKVGKWVVTDMSRAKLLTATVKNDYEIEVNITSGKSGFFTLVYVVNEKPLTTLDVKVLSL